MRTPVGILLALAPVVLAAAPAAAGLATNGNCLIADHGLGLVGYQNACLGFQDGWHSWGPGYDYSHEENRLASTSMAFVGQVGTVPLVETWGFDTARQYQYHFHDEAGGFTSDHAYGGTEVGSVRFLGVADQVGAGYSLSLQQEDTTYESCYGGQCSGFDSTFTNLYGSAYVSVRGGPSVGIGGGYHQSTFADTCHEWAQVGVSALVTYVPVPLVEGAPCTFEAPDLREAAPFPVLPTVLPPL